MLHPKAAPQSSRTPSVQDRRVAVRYSCDRASLISPASPSEGPGDTADETDLLGTVDNISAGGLGILLPTELPPDTLLAVVPLEVCWTKALLAHVVSAEERDAGWYHRCQLNDRPSTRELQDWLS